jgi:hypothetical protein
MKENSKMFFFKKKNQKMFAPLRVVVPSSLSYQTNQVFFAAFLFIKKQTLLQAWP